MGLPAQMTVMAAGNADRLVEVDKALFDQLHHLRRCALLGGHPGQKIAGGVRGGVHGERGEQAAADVADRA